MKRNEMQKGRKSFSLSATLGFLLLAAALVSAGVLTVRGMLLGREERVPEAAAASPAPAMQEQEQASSEAAALLIPEGGRLPTPSPMHEETPSPSPEEPDAAPVPTAAPEPVRAGVAPPFSKERMVFAIIGFDAARRADALLIVSVDGRACSMLSLPRNTLITAGHTLGDAKKAAQALTDIGEVFPLKIKEYIELDMAGLADCVDAFGGIELGGVPHTGNAAAAFLEAGGSDELLRITRQQELLHALSIRLGETGILRLLSAKHTLQKYTRGSLDAAQYVDLYSALRRVDAANIRFLTLPVDSVIENGARFYRADSTLSGKLAKELFPDAF